MLLNLASTANASFLYPNYAPNFEVVTRLHQNTETPFDEDSLHATSHSAVLIANPSLPISAPPTTSARSAQAVLIEAATTKCPMTGRLKKDDHYHATCQFGSRNGAFEALLLRIEIMVDEKMVEQRMGLKSRRTTSISTESTREEITAGPDKMLRKRRKNWASEGGEGGIGSWNNRRPRSVYDGATEMVLSRAQSREV